jgi:hypothetical protein
MYDFDMGDAARHGVGFPTPACFHYFHTHRRRWAEWLSDYFVRLSQAQGFDQLQAVTRVVDCYMLMSRANVEDGIRTLQNELQEGEWATDLQIIEPTGERRPRPSVVNFFQAEARLAHDWLRDRMFRTQRELVLDFHQMNQIKAAYLESVRREIRMRRMLGHA